MGSTLAKVYGWGSWAWLVIPIASYCVISLTLFAFGRTESDNVAGFFFGQISDSLRRATGFPGWSMAGVLSGLLMLLIAMIGFYWDVAWHVDNGRDQQLFTPAHTMILVGLAGLLYTAGLTILFASLDKAPGVPRLGPVHIPWSAVLLGALGIGGAAAFPLDALWHEAYGIDVTLWSPTHLQLVGGGSLATVALWLTTMEARPWAEPTLLGRGIQVLAAGTVLVGLSTFQAEFDFGVPQFQVLYLPLLVMVAAGFTLVAARMALGPWGAVKVVAVYLVLRGFIALAVGGALHHTVPAFPLYLPSALAVEAAAWWLGSQRPARLALGAGALVGTVGLAGELTLLGLWGRSAELPPALVAKIAVLGLVAAVASAVVGTGLGGAVAHAGERMPAAAVAGAGLAVLAVLAFPLPRNVGDVTATVRLQQVGSLAGLTVDLDPPTAARKATAFVVMSWQGGQTVRADLREVSPGHFVASRPVPVTGSWKTMVSLQRGDQVMAVPVYLPADPQIGAPEVPALPVRTERFVRNTTVLLREQHPGPAWPAVAAYCGLAALMALWAGLIAQTARRLPPPQPAGASAPGRRFGPSEPAMAARAHRG